jgi:hypothetical protein
MRRYLQGTLDYACGLYAVVNALSCLYGLKLAGARHIFEKTMLELAAEPFVWKNFLANNTDHYWLARHLLRRWGAERTDSPYPFSVTCPLGARTPCNGDLTLADADMFLPETHMPSGPASAADSQQEAAHTWRTVFAWLSGKAARKRAAILRFHRFLPNVPEPVVSHWTAVSSADQSALRLHDASSENNALHCLDKAALLPAHGLRAMVRVVPESVYFLETR